MLSEDVAVETKQPFIVWEERFSVNIREVDRQHKVLIELINKLHSNREEGDPRWIGDILTQLENYTVFHFDWEEKFMARYGYEESDKHKLIHKKFVAKIAEARRKFEAGRTEALGDGLLEFLQDWLLSHIMKVDKQYAAHLNKCGVY